MSTPEPLRWLHLSDLHLKSGAVYGQDVVLNALFRSLPDLMERHGHPDLLFITGDISHSGQKEELLQARAAIDSLVSIVGVPLERVFVIPGNHDVDRLRATGLSRTLSDTEEADLYFSPDKPLIHIEKKLSAFGAFYDDLFTGIRAFSDRSTVTVERLTVRNMDIAVALIDSAAFCLDDNDAHKLFVGRRCVEQACASIGNVDLSFALIHHPLNWLSPVESTQVKALLHDNFDLVLTGHLHENEVEQVVGSSGDTLHLSCGALYQTRKWPNTAMFCTLTDSKVTVTPIHYVDTPRPAWTLDTSLFLNSQSYEGFYSLSGAHLPNAREDSNMNDESAAPNGEADHSSIVEIQNSDTSEVIAAKAQLDERLFSTPTGLSVLATPRIMERTQLAALDADDGKAITVEEIADSNDSFYIEARPEYGGTTLCKLVQVAVLSRKKVVISRNARDLPTYRKKVISEFGSLEAGTDNKPVLIIDDFDLDRDGRTLSEIYDAEVFCRVVIVSVNRGLLESVSTDVAELPFKPKLYHLWAMSRSGIRQFAETVLETRDSISVERAVSKVYDDLLKLKIPLTPSNILMYLRVLEREGDFEPLSRVDILSRYLSESLRRPSDVANDSFNSKNKLDVLSSFGYWLYQKQTSEFSKKDWSEFCSSYQKKTLSEFGADEFLNELLGSKVFATYRGNIYFRYGFYYTFFVGRYLWPRPAALNAFIASQDFMANPAVIEVVTGLSSDNVDLLTSLTSILEEHVKEFDTKYVRGTFDPLLTAIWPSNENDEEKVWKPVQEAIAAGPAESQSIDELKSSMLAEARTANQQITFERFTQLENALFVESHILGEALKNADDVDGTIKLRAWRAVLNAALIVLQVGTMFAPALAKRKRFSWGGVTFIDFDRAAKGCDANSPEAFVGVVISLATAVATKASQDYGSVKLGPVFRMTSQNPEVIGFHEVVNFTCIITARGRGWVETASTIIDRTDKNAFYLSEFLHQMMNSLKYEIMPGRDRDGLKRLVAQVRAKRDFNKQAPGSKAVTKMLSYLEKDKYFPSAVKNE